MARLYKHTGKEVLDMFEKYLLWLKTQPYYKADLIKSGERAGEQVNIEIEKPPTIEGFCLFTMKEGKILNKQTIYRAMEKYNSSGDNEISEDEYELFNAFTYVYEYIKDKQIGGAINNLYNPMLVARINNITETVNVTGQAIQPVIINVLNQPMDLKGLYEPITECEILPNSPE